MEENKPILCEMKNLCTAFRIKDDYFNAVENVNLSLYQNEVLAIVGESGCGKSTLATTIMGLHNFNFTKVSGEVIFEGKNILNSTEDEYNKIRGGKIGMIFQDPNSTMDPIKTIEKQFIEYILEHNNIDLSSPPCSPQIPSLIAGFVSRAFRTASCINSNTPLSSK